MAGIVKWTCKVGHDLRIRKNCYFKRGSKAGQKPCAICQRKRKHEKYLRDKAAGKFVRRTKASPVIYVMTDEVLDREAAKWLEAHGWIN